MSSASRATIRIVLTTLDAATDGRALARTLVEERLAACVNILPTVTSVYRWKGYVEEEAEQQLVIKTSQDALEALKTRLLTLHPYETPELLVLEAHGSEAYADWVGTATAWREGEGTQTAVKQT